MFRQLYVSVGNYWQSNLTNGRRSTETFQRKKSTVSNHNIKIAEVTTLHGTNVSYVMVHEIAEK